MSPARSGDSNPTEDNLIKIEPEDDLVFIKDDAEDSKATGNVVITNTTNGHITFKIKTNNIEGYKVKPFFGVVQSGKTFHIKVEQNPGSVFHGTDKLLVLTTPIAAVEMSPKELLDLWKTVAKDAIKEHRLRLVNHNNVQSKVMVTKDESAYRSVGSLLMKPKSPSRKDVTKQESSVSFGPSRQRLSTGTAQLDNIQEGLADLQSKLGELAVEFQTTSKNVEQIWFVAGGSAVALLATLTLLVVIKICLSTPEWFC
ncbi:motile sperm domain-containing protein 2-like [Ornithodoros turicata]|uniref:motile sperm domain-containing protein 2-like n=1 Tax=Ornithodoros turicata TaxID=34597 RepID=UPI00313A3980